MTKEEKFDYINKRCDEYWDSKEMCYKCPVWKYIRQNNIDFCDELSTDKQYDILVNDED